MMEWRPAGARVETDPLCSERQFIGAFRVNQVVTARQQVHFKLRSKMSGKH